MENVQKRLLLIYGMRYGIKMESEKGRYTKVVIPPAVPERAGGQDMKMGMSRLLIALAAVAAGGAIYAAAGGIRRFRKMRGGRRWS